VILRLDGEPLPPIQEGADPKKILTCPGSHGGLMNAGALDRLERAQVVWKVEGVTDMLALQSAIPAEFRDTHIVITNSGGCQENPKDEWVNRFKSKTLYVVGDADIPGSPARRSGLMPPLGSRRQSRACRSRSRLRRTTVRTCGTF
jgi:hypothetical protein